MIYCRAQDANSGRFFLISAHVLLTACLFGLQQALLVREVDFFVDDDVFNFLSRGTVERELTDNHGVHEDSKSPNVYFWVTRVIAL